jgi:hypothetical protein
LFEKNSPKYKLNQYSKNWELTLKMNKIDAIALKNLTIFGFLDYINLLVADLLRYWLRLQLKSEITYRFNMIDFVCKDAGEALDYRSTKKEQTCIKFTVY